MLATVPELFGMRRAQIDHPTCGCDGGDGCVYEIHWEQGMNVTLIGGDLRLARRKARLGVLSGYFGILTPFSSGETG